MRPGASADNQIYIGGTGDLASESGWTLIGEVTNIGEFGPEFSMITHQPIGTRATNKFKGPADAGDPQLQILVDDDDAGQIALLAAAKNKHDDFNFRVLRDDAITTSGTTYTWKAKVASYRRNSGDVSSNFTVTVTLAIIGGEDAITETAAT